MWLKQVPASVCGLWLYGPLQVRRAQQRSEDTYKSVASATQQEK